MIQVPVAKQAFSWKTYGFVAFENLSALKQAIVERGWTKVHLVLVDPWDGSWEYHRTDIPLEELGEEDLAWLAASERGGRYLQCGLEG